MTVDQVVDVIEMLRLDPTSGRGMHSSSPMLEESDDTIPDMPAEEHARAVLFALQAGHEEDVRRYRETFLGGTLLNPEKVDSWISEHLESQRTPGTFGPITIVFGGRARRLLLRTDLDTEHSGLTSLEYSVPGSSTTKLVVTDHEGGPLDSLQQVAEALSSRYPWSVGQATLFVLTGRPPIVETVIAKLSKTPDEDPTGVRVVMSVDPTVPPERVASEYAALRRDVLARRHRPLSEKHARLTAFVAVREHESWPDRRLAWNNAHPQWAYSDRESRNFVRDALKAKARLLNPPVVRS